MVVLSPERMKRYDEYAIDRWGIPSTVLMENAGRTTYRLLKEAYLQPGKRIAVFCGRGNNGGDGFVIARYALRDGFQTEVFLLGEPSGVKGDALINMELYRSLGGSVTSLRDNADAASQGITKSDLIIDAIFGTGLTKEVGGIERAVIEAINASGKPVIAVDIPSGLDGARGIPLGVAVKATHTYTYGFPKIGQLLHPGVACRGKLTVVDISLPQFSQQELGVDGYLVDGKMLRSIYKKRPPDAHKGMFGHLVVIAGSAGKTGAAAMASLAALKIGAGLVTLVIPSSLSGIVGVKLTEAMTYPVEDRGKGYFPLASYEEIRDFVGDKDVIVMGPGLGRSEETMILVRKLYARLDKPFVIDADGINAFDGHLDVLREHGENAVFTPHPGEFGRLAGKSPRQVNADRLGEGRRFVEEHKVNLVLKGTPTVTFSPDGKAFINPTGGPALSKGGSGDILTGFIGGLVSQGYGMAEAAAFGVYLHGYIADSWTEKYTDMDLLAGDLLSGVGEAIRDIRNGTDRVYIEESL
ncbi:MAG: Bifunctional NAD(P)H-hydrate repair enzyme Nnr [Syntrophorhabdaceae bacterium PtaU1.Bin034]|nr:MAG: Bifunctional NAD(P)H-hydrate repair enzyme Nnr [Syntrophorhabdaceae bacterium PtaU1.Bin034]